MSQVGRDDWWTMPAQDLAKELRGIGLHPSASEKGYDGTAILQARAVLEVATDTRNLVFATGRLWLPTAVVALVACLPTLGLPSPSPYQARSLTLDHRSWRSPQVPDEGL
jgi:hypothetical protein